MQSVDSVDKLRRVVNLKLGLRVVVFVVGLLFSLFVYLTHVDSVPDVVWDALVEKNSTMYLYSTGVARGDFYFERVLPNLRADIAAEIFYSDALEYVQYVVTEALERFEENGYVATRALKYLNSSDPRLGRFTSKASDAYCPNTVMSELDDVQAILDLCSSFLAVNPTSEANLAIFMESYTDLVDQAKAVRKEFMSQRLSDFMVVVVLYTVVYMGILGWTRVVPWVTKNTSQDFYSNLNSISVPCFEEDEAGNLTVSFDSTAEDFGGTASGEDDV